jgi:hypothetical protein
VLYRYKKTAAPRFVSSQSETIKNNTIKMPHKDIFTAIRNSKMELDEIYFWIEGYHGEEICLKSFMIQKQIIFIKTL